MESTSVASVAATSSEGKFQFTLNHYTDYVRLTDLVGVIHRVAEPRLELLEQRLVHNLSVVRRSLDADTPTFERQFSSVLREGLPEKPLRFFFTDVLHPVALPEPLKLFGLL